MLGWFLLESNQPDEAEPLLRECLAIRRQELLPDSWELANARNLLGGCLAQKRQFHEAEALLLSSYEQLTKEKNAPPLRVRDALDRIVQLYDAWGRPEQSEVWRQKRRTFSEKE